ncbi:MAG TPA: efflux RND transporter periplasmic adaptor subunit [Bacteroidia bacterium]|jgi:membrane fusion protein (multidrug efflux system)|nr:efflux RND transporter periplasmic adaptor subunit [Bacteroidia bacterium]
MKRMIKHLAPLALLMLIASCQPKTDAKSNLADLKKQRDELSAKITLLESELNKKDTLATKVPVVSVNPVSRNAFRSYVEIQGRIDADDNITLSPQMAGAVSKINVKVGDAVHTGDLLAEIDNKVILQGIAELQNGLDLANTMYEKQKNLWDQKIGTEVQYLNAKSQKEGLEKKMASLQQQLELSRIKSPINGTVDAVDLRLGQIAAPGMPGIRVVNFENLKVKGEVSEAFVNRVNKGDAVDIVIPDTGDSIKGTIDFAAKVISSLNRTFTVQVNLDNKKQFHPNMIAIMRIVDYINPKAIVVPMNAIQHAEEGDFILVAVNNKAHKQAIKTDHIYQGQAEIKEGLKEGDLVIMKGFQELNEGETIKY